MLKKLKLLILTGCLCMVSVAVMSVMPGNFYAGLIESSKIKATAVIEKKELVSSNEYSRTYRLFFRTINNYGDLPAGHKFTGLLLTSIAGKNPPLGGNLYFSLPAIGQKFYVTMPSHEGNLSSLTDLTPHLEYALDNNPDAVIAGMTSVHLSEEFRKSISLAALDKANQKELDINDDSIFLSTKQLYRHEAEVLLKALREFQEKLLYVEQNRPIPQELFENLQINVQKSIKILEGNP